jgi:CheY-like chemotaxis protein
MALIVIAEDEFLLANVLVDLLEDADHEVVLAPHGRAAFEFVKQKRPDLLITDYMMPLMNGQELALAVRGDPALAALPILLISGAQGHIGASRPDLFDVVQEKPFTIEVLPMTVDGLLRHGRRSGHK